MNEENQKKLKKFKEFDLKSKVHPNLPITEELSSINDNLKTIADKESPEVQKVFIENLEALMPKEEQLIELIIPLIPPAIPGKDYVLTEKDKKEIAKSIKVPVVEKVIEIITEKQPIVTQEIKEVAVSDSPEQVRDKLETLKDEERIDVSAIKGFDETLKSIKDSGKSVQIKSGGSRGFQLYVGSTKKGLAQFVNLVAGPNMTISDSMVNGLHTITFTSSGGSGFTKLSATETPDGSLKAFTFAAALAKPSFLVVDNVWQQPVTATGTVNWTWSGTVATLAVPASDDIWGVV